jgi:hypothetical protein
MELSKCLNEPQPIPKFSLNGFASESVVQPNELFLELTRFQVRFKASDTSSVTKKCPWRFVLRESIVLLMGYFKRNLTGPRL